MNQTNIPERSNASDRLANERTFLAWVRTGLGIVALGFVIIKFSLLLEQLVLFNYKEKINSRPEVNALIDKQPFADMTGLVLMLFGCLLIVLSYIRYHTSDKQLQRGNFNPISLLPFLTTVIVVLLVILLSAYLFL